MEWESFKQNYTQINSILDQAIRAAEGQGNRFLTIQNGRLELTNHSTKAVPLETVAKFLESLPKEKEGDFTTLKSKLSRLEEIKGTTQLTDAAAATIFKGNLAEKLTASLDHKSQELLKPVITDTLKTLKENNIKGENAANIFYLVLGDVAQVSAKKESLSLALTSLTEHPAFRQQVDSYFMK